MIIEQIKTIALDSDIETVASTISTENMGFMFNIVSKSYYSRPIDSIVREITSNCVDSHIEAGVDEPIIIKSRYNIEDSNYSIIFKDIGLGISPDRMMNIYQKWFSSTKRDTNDMIGGFGLGSKSPFSYTDDFQIRTVYNNKLYEYIYILTESYPKLISLHGYDTEIVETEEEILNTVTNEIEIKKLITETKVPIGIPIEEQNGTEIIITLKSDKDLILFENSIKKELCYFDSVYVLGFNINNDYTIFNNNTFLYRKDGYSNELHISLGKVCYPIDWKMLKREPIKLPFGVKFNIGELQVTPNRENLIYGINEDGDCVVADLINKRIDECLKEVNSLLSKKGVKETDNIYEYLTLKDSKPSITFGEYKVTVPKEYITVNTDIQYTPLKHLNIKIPDNPFFIFELSCEIDKGVLKKIGFYRILSVYESKFNIMLKDTDSCIYTNILLNNKVLYVIPPLKELYFKVAEQLGFYTYRKGYNYRGSQSLYAKDKTKDYKVRENYKDLPDEQKYEMLQVQLGKPKIILEYINHIKSLVNCSNYSSEKASDEWIENYKKELRESQIAYKRKLNKEIVVRIDGRKSIKTIGDLIEYDAVVYDIAVGNTIKYNENLGQVETNLNCINSLNKEVQISKYSKKSYWKTKILLIEVTKNNLPMLKELTNLVPVEDFVKSDIFNKYNQDICNFRFLVDTIREFHNVTPSFATDTNKYNTIIHPYDRMLKKYKNISTYKLYKLTTPTKEFIDLKKRIEKETEKLKILKYLSYNIPKELLISITCKLKSTLVREEYLGLNPVKKKKECRETNNLLIF